MASLSQKSLTILWLVAAAQIIFLVSEINCQTGQGQGKKKPGGKKPPVTAPGGAAKSPLATAVAPKVPPVDAAGQPIPLPTDQPGDPTDGVINADLYYSGAFIYENNPCKGFHEDGEYNSKKNKDRRHGCDKARDRLRDAVQTAPSKRCQTIQESRCFQFNGKESRCYVQVVKNGKAAFELINNCEKDPGPAQAKPAKPKLKPGPGTKG